MVLQKKDILELLLLIGLIGFMIMFIAGSAAFSRAENLNKSESKDVIVIDNNNVSKKSEDNLISYQTVSNNEKSEKPVIIRNPKPRPWPKPKPLPPKRIIYYVPCWYDCYGTYSSVTTYIDCDDDIYTDSSVQSAPWDIIPPAPWSFDEMWMDLQDVSDFSSKWKMTYKDRFIEFEGEVMRFSYNEAKNQSILMLKCRDIDGEDIDTLLKIDEKIDNIDQYDRIGFYGLIKNYEKTKKIVHIQGLTMWEEM
jgi:hypothetical protein